VPKIEFFRLVTSATPREILEADFPSLRGGLPIQGGWGYTLDGACIIDRDDPTVDPQMPFDGVGIEYLFAEYRLYEELIVFREPGHKYAGISHKLQRQSSESSEDGRRFDHLIFDVEALREEDFEELKAEWDGPDGHESFDLEAHLHKRAQRICTGETEYWFDITSFFGR